MSMSPSTSATTGPALPAAHVVLILSLLLGLQPITTDLYLPALPALTTGFGAPMAQAQLTLTALLLAFGLSQLVWGPQTSAVESVASRQGQSGSEPLSSVKLKRSALPRDPASDKGFSAPHPATTTEETTASEATTSGPICCC